MVNRLLWMPILRPTWCIGPNIHACFQRKISHGCAVLCGRRLLSRPMTAIIFSSEGTIYNPAGPFKDVLGKPLIDKIVNGAQPIDQFVFRDDDGTYYMYYGGWGHCNIVKLSPDLLGVVPFDDGTVYKEVTPQDYVEGPFMLKRNGKYYFMWSEGGWGSPDYRVAYAIADSPFGPFRREGIILQQDADVATGAGHHSVVRGKGKDEWYIIYHRRPLGETAANSRATCIDRMYFDKKGKIKPVRMTFEGVKATQTPLD